MSENIKLEIKEDERGKLIEIFKTPGFGQVFYSTSKPGVTRGNHYHKRKIEKFCVIEGEGKITLRNITTNVMREYDVSGTKPQIVEMPVNWTHNIKNVGDTEMKLLVLANEVFNPADPDIFPEKV